MLSVVLYVVGLLLAILALVRIVPMIPDDVSSDSLGFLLALLVLAGGMVVVAVGRALDLLEELTKNTKRGEGE